jgi:hypothetical protein
VRTSKKALGSLAVLILLMAIARPHPQAQGSNPLVGGSWDRYSIKNAQGVESGSAGWFFLTFTADGQFFITGVPKGHEKLAKAAKEMTKEELVRHLEGIQVRRGRYTLTGNGSPYRFTLTDETNPLSPSLQGSCAASAPCEIRIVNGEVNLYSASNGVRTQWRRVLG